MANIIQFNIPINKEIYEKGNIEFKIKKGNVFKDFEKTVDELCIMFDIFDRKNFRKDFEDMILKYDYKDIDIVRDMDLFFTIIYKYVKEDGEKSAR